MTLKSIRLANPRLPLVVGGLCVAFLFAQGVLGWGLGITDAGWMVLVAASIIAVLVITDALDGRTRTTDEPYDVVVCAVVAVAVAGAVACLYVPLPWGGLCSAAVVAVLVVVLRVLSQRSR